MTERARIYGNNPAFPTGHLKVGDYQGITLRDLFSVVAMGAFLSTIRPGNNVDVKDLGIASVACADCLLEELVKTDKYE